MDFQLPYCFFFLLLLLLPFSSNGQAHSNISLGSALTAATDNLPWTSPSGEFAFGFQQVGDAGYLLAIWFNKIPERTIVWSANRNDLVQGGSRVQLTEDGELVLNDQSGRKIWSSQQSGGSGAAYAAMLDTGNFVVASQAGANLWQSFDEPTDTLLPTQNLNLGAKLIAPYRKTAAPGSRNRAIDWKTSPSFVPSNICMRIGGQVGSGACGFNSYCRLGDDQRPSCLCPPGYTFLDPNDERKGCKQIFTSQDCDRPSDGIDNFEIKGMLNTDWPGNDYEDFSSVEEDWCEQACLNDCYCAAAIFNSGDCLKKRTPLSNGRTDPSVGGKALIKVRKGNWTAGSSAKKS